METQRSKQASVFMWILVSGLFSHNFVIPVMSSTTAFEDQKNYYPPDPHAGTPPTDPHAGTPPTGTPPTGTHHPPSHGPPSHGHGPPSHGGNCGNPPTPSTPHGGTPHHDPPTPSVPTGGGYYHSPPPTGGSGTPPVTISPPTTPIDPGTPTTPIPGIPVPSSPPFVFDPHTPFTGTCYFWSTHPAAIWGLIGWFGTLGGTFGATSFPGSTPTLSLPQALSNTRTDGYGALYREGTASLLNSMVNHRFPYTTTHVRDSFIAALGSNKAASAQARLFKMANEGRLKPRA